MTRRVTRLLLLAIGVILASRGLAAGQPLPPSNLQHITLGAAVRLTWTAPPGVATFRIEAGSASIRADIATTSVSGTSAAFCGVPLGTYFVRVRSIVGSAVSQPSNEVALVVAPPGTPTGLAASVAGTTISLTWTPPASGGVESYVLEAGSGPGGTNLARLVVSTPAFSTTGVPAGVYYVRVRAANSAGVGSASPDVVITVGGPSVPGPPESLSTITSAGSIVLLQWRAPSDGGAPTGYRVEAGTAPGLSDVAALTIGNTLSMTAVAPEGVYFARVRALNAFGTGAASNEVTVNGIGVRNGIPTSGVPVPQLAAFDQAITAFMAGRGIGAATLSISRGAIGSGAVLLERGYGWSDRARTVPILPHAPFRLASVAKPITASIIHRLAGTGRLSISDRVFCTGSNAPCHLTLPAGTIRDTRAGAITIAQVLAHQGGWDRAISGDPMFTLRQVASDLGVPSPVTKGDIVRWLAGRTLDFTPGSRSAYSNIGYLVLGQIVERVTGRAFEAEMQQSIFVPLGTASTEVYTGRSLPAARNPREPVYEDPYTTTSLFPPYGVVPWPDGGMLIEAFEAHGGIVATSRSVARFLSAYWISGQARSTVVGQEWTFYGSMPGTLTMARQLPSGVNIAILMNTRFDRNRVEINPDDLRTLLDGVAAQINWNAVPAP